MALMTYTDPYTGGPGFYTGTGATNLVPDVFPVALNGRPYIVDLESNQFRREFEPRVRDSSDNSTSPGESAVNPQGLWRRGQKSWHKGAGQFYADDEYSQPFMFYRSRGVNPWTKGQLTLHNAVKTSLSSANTNLPLVQAGNYTYVGDGTTLKYTTDPFASSPTWTSVTTGAPAGKAVTALATDGDKVYIAYADSGIYSTSLGGSTVVAHYAAQGTLVGFDAIESVKGYILAGHDNNEGGSASHIHVVPITASPTTHTSEYEHPIASFKWVGFAAGQNAIYAAGHTGGRSTIYKITIKSDGTLDVPTVALELPTREIVTTIHGYLGFILLGTNKGVRYCTTDGDANLVAGPIIPTSGDVLDFSADGRYCWFTYTAYDSTHGGLGRLDLAEFVTVNQPAWATDLMHQSTSAVNSVISKDNKRIFSISGVGVLVEDTANLVTTGYLETGYYTWDIPDRKFMPRFDIRVAPLAGSVQLEVAYDRGSYSNAGLHNDTGDTEHTFLTDQEKFLEAGFKLTLNRASALSGPIFTRWMARAFAAVKRSRVITIPVILHETISVHGRDIYLDVEQERALLENLVEDPRVVNYQERNKTLPVIVENIQWIPLKSSQPSWLWEGTAVIELRTVAE